MSLLEPAKTSSHSVSRNNPDTVDISSIRSKKAPGNINGRTVKVSAQQALSGQKQRPSQRSTFGTAPRFQETFITSNGLSGIAITGRNTCHAAQGCSKRIPVTRSVRMVTSDSRADKHLDYKTSVFKADLTNSSGPYSFERTTSDMKALREVPAASFEPEILDGGYGSTDTLSDVTDIEDFEENIFEAEVIIDEEQLEIIRERWKAESRELREKVRTMWEAETSNTVLSVELINQHQRLKQRDDYQLFVSRLNQDLTLFTTSGRASMQVYRELNRLMNDRGFDKSRLEGKASKEIFDVLWAEKIIIEDISEDVDLEGSPFW